MGFLYGLLWVVLVPVKLSFYVVKFPLAPIAVTFFSTDDRKHLEWPFTYMETLDNSLDGDSGWQTEHIEPGSDPLSDWNRINWLWRNGFNTIDFKLLGIDYNPNVEPERFGLTFNEDGAWRYRQYFGLDYIPGMENKHFELYLGWCIYCKIEGKGKYSMTIRIQNNQ